MNQAFVLALSYLPSRDHDNCNSHGSIARTASSNFTRGAESGRVQWT